MDNFKLIVDQRETLVHRYGKEHWGGLNWELKTITIGDYIVTMDDGKNKYVVACIERKSLSDFSASMKDGRHSNKDKLRYLQRRTGCRVLYIIEGKRVKSSTKVGGIPYRNIESAIIHMEMKYKWAFHYTADEIDTAGFLKRFIQSLFTLHASGELPLSQFNIIKSDGVPVAEPDPLPTDDEIDSDIAAIIGGEEPMEVTAPDTLTINDLVTMSFEKTDDALVREMWSAITGITVRTATIYMKFTLAEVIIAKEGIAKEIAGLKYTNGRSISKKVIKKLQKLTTMDHIAILARIPRISKNTASLILASTTLPAMLADDFDFTTFRYAETKKLTKPVIANIKKLFHFKK